MNIFSTSIRVTEFQHCYIIVVLFHLYHRNQCLLLALSTFGWHYNQMFISAQMLKSITTEKKLKISNVTVTLFFVVAFGSVISTTESFYLQPFECGTLCNCMRLYSYSSYFYLNQWSNSCMTAPTHTHRHTHTDIYTCCNIKITHTIEEDFFTHPY